MEKEFVSYAQALALKELDFDEPCFALFNRSDKPVISGNTPVFNSKTEDDLIICTPLYQQAFRWFREKHKLYSPITDNGLGQYDFRVKHEWCGRVYDTYEEAESACLDKLIEITKNK